MRIVGGLFEEDEGLMEQHLLLLQTKAGRAEEAEAIMEDGGAVAVPSVAPAGAGPEQRR